MLLKSAQLLSLQSKLSLYDYYLCIEKITDATGTADVNVSRESSQLNSDGLTSSKDRYKAFLRTLREWRHLKMMKRGGRSYDPTGVNGTSPGELAVLCPACPIPTVNLPPNWQSAGKENEFVYLLYEYSFSLTLFVTGICTTSHSGLMHVFASRGGRFQAMKKTLSSVLGVRTLLRGVHIASTSVASLISGRFVLFICTH